VNLLSRERVRLNQELARRRVIMKVLGIQVPPDATLKEVAALYEERVEQTDVRMPPGREEDTVLEGYDEREQLIGYVFHTSGSGFWAPIKGYVAVSPELDRILGLAFYQQSETPGLGAEITKPWFQEQFRDRKLPPQPPREGKLIGLVREGAEKGPYDVDAITGATQTSKAVEELFNEDLRNFLHAMKEQEAR
jgi:Na+-transporting NADH:ubiquinone oxidoreductase subunit C